MAVVDLVGMTEVVVCVDVVLVAVVWVTYVVNGGGVSDFVGTEVVVEVVTGLVLEAVVVDCLVFLTGLFFNEVPTSSFSFCRTIFFSTKALLSSLTLLISAVVLRPAELT